MGFGVSWTMPATAKKLLAEAIGTFMLVSAVCGAAMISFDALGGGAGIVGVALAVGLAVMVMAYAVGPISGAHFNPAVTCGLFSAGRFKAKDIGPYVIAQVVGGVLAALVLFIILKSKIGWSPGGFASNGYGEHSPGGYSASACLLAEIVLTALFVFIVCRVTREGSGAGIMAPIAIGLTLTVMHLISFPVANTSLNPARSTATALFAESWALQQLWMFWLAPLIGGVLGGIADRFAGEVS